MLPKRRLICEEPGCTCPGVPDKSNWGLGSISRYSARILICFIAYIFLFYSSVGFVGEFAGLPPCTVPSAIVHCDQNEAGHQTIKSPIMPCWGAAGWHSLAIMPQDWWNWKTKWMKPQWRFSVQEPSDFFLFLYLWVILLYFSPESRLISGVLELGQVRLFWKLIRSRIWQLSHSCRTGVCILQAV